MSIMQEKAYEMIKRFSDDKLPADNDDSMTVEQKACEDLQQFRRCSDIEIDYKEELAQALEEKYASIKSHEVSKLRNPH